MATAKCVSYIRRFLYTLNYEIPQPDFSTAMIKQTALSGFYFSKYCKSKKRQIRNKNYKQLFKNISKDGMNVISKISINCSRKRSDKTIQHF